MEQTATKIVYWYDRHTRNWIVQVKDENGYEMDYSYSGNKISRDFEIECFKKEYNLTIVEKL